MYLCSVASYHIYALILFDFFFLHEVFRGDIGATQSCPSFLLSYLQDLEDLQIVGEGVQCSLFF